MSTNPHPPLVTVIEPPRSDYNPSSTAMPATWGNGPRGWNTRWREMRVTRRATPPLGTSV
jgi:hypothetical protein